jgi:hypothetical protein
MLGNFTDSTIVGLVSLRLLRGGLLSRLLTSAMLGFVSFSLLNRNAARSSGFHFAGLCLRRRKVLSARVLS